EARRSRIRAARRAERAAPLRRDDLNPRLLSLSFSRLQRGVLIGDPIRVSPYIRSVADIHIGDHVYVTPISRACWNEDHLRLIPLTRINHRLSRPVRERI